MTKKFHSWRTANVINIWYSCLWEIFYTDFSNQFMFASYKLY